MGAGCGAGDLVAEFFGPRRLAAWVVVLNENVHCSFWLDLETVDQNGSGCVRRGMTAVAADRRWEFVEVRQGTTFDIGLGVDTMSINRLCGSNCESARLLIAVTEFTDSLCQFRNARGQLWQPG